MTSFDIIVVGAGLRGLQAALRTRSHQPGARMLVVDRQAWPGNDVRTQRSNGFTCELGPMAFTEEELAPHQELLQKPPRTVSSNPEAKSGWLFDGEHLRALRVEPEPISFATGCEDLVQAYRRDLDGCLRLGRAVTQLQPREGDGFVVTLGGEVPSELEAEKVMLAVSTSDAARMLGAFDPELPVVAEQEVTSERAFVWLGGLSKDAPELQGYGVLPHPDLASPLAEVIFCTNVFRNRSMPDRFLVRVETAMDDLPKDDEALVRSVVEEVRRWTKTKAAFGFTKVYRFAVPVADGTQAECRTRLTETVAQVPGLSLA